MIKNFMAERLFKAMTAMIPHNTMAMKTDNKNTMPENLPVTDGIGRAKTRIKFADKKKLRDSSADEN